MSDNMEFARQCRLLWKNVFDDSDDFMNFYFAKRFTPKNTISELCNGRVASAMQSLPYNMSFGNSTIRTGYVSGLATLPEFRNRGLAARVLHKSHRRLYEDGFVLSLLIPATPALYNYYRRMHYATCFYYAEERIEATIYTGTDKNIEFVQNPQLTSKIIDFIQDEMRKRTCCIQHSQRDLEDIYQAVQYGNGGFPLLLNNKRISAVAVTEHINGTLRINDTFGAPKDKSMLLGFISSTESDSAKIVRNYAKRDKPYGMARIINVKRFADLIAGIGSKADYTFTINDDEITENCGTYSIKNGKCRFSASSSDSPQAISPAELADMLLSPLHPVMSLMLD